MTNLPYHIIAFFSVIGSFFIGIGISSAADHISRQAERRGELSVYMEMPMHVLMQMPIIENARNI